MVEPVPTTVPTPTDPAVPASDTFTMASNVVRNGLQPPTIRITPAANGKDGLTNAAVTFKYPNNGLAAPATAQSRTFELSMPMLTFLLAGCVDVDATADGVAPYNGRIMLGWFS